MERTRKERVSKMQQGCPNSRYVDSGNSLNNHELITREKPKVQTSSKLRG